MVKRKKHHKRKKWSHVRLDDSKNGKSGREWSALQVLAGEVAKIKPEVSFEEMEEKLRSAERDFSVQRGLYTTLSLLRWFLKEKLGVDDEQQREKCVSAYFDEFLHAKWFTDPPDLYPGAVEVLRRLKKEGVKTAAICVCSLHVDGLRRFLAHFGHDDLFDVIVCANEMEGTDRPLDAAYNAAIEKLDLKNMEPQRLLFVGNETDQDIVGGNRMGWKTCLLMTTENTSRGLATFEAENWIDLANEVIWPRKFIKKNGKKEAGTSFEDTLKPVTEQNLDINPFIQAVAGHRWQEGKQGFLKGGDRVYKPLQDDGSDMGKGMREADFYRVVQEMGAQHFPFVPRCYGVRNFVVNSAVPEVSPAGVPIRNRILPHLVLEDVTAPFDEPSVLDVKIGLVTYDPSTTDLEKIVSQTRKYPNQKEMGYSVAGMRVFNVVTKQYETRDRQWGRALRRQDASLVFDTFFWNGKEFQVDAAVYVLSELLHVRDWMSKTTSHRFYSSSLLIVYEGDDTEDAATVARQLDESETDESHNDVTVRMIDFPHVVPSKDNTPDENYLKGIDLLIQDCQTFIDKHKKK